MNKNKQIGLAVIGCGVVGRIRATFAKEYPGIGWIGLSDHNRDLGQKLKNDISADFFSDNYVDLIKMILISPIKDTSNKKGIGWKRFNN